MKGSWIALVLVFMFMWGCVTPAKKKSPFDQAYEKYLEYRTKCDEFTKNCQSVMNTWKKEHDDLEQEWDTFYYGLSNEQIDAMNTFFKYRNRESALKFESAVSKEQYETFQYISNRNRELKKLYEDVIVVIPEKIKEVEKIVEQAWQMVKEIAYLQNRRTEQLARATSDLSNQMLDLGREIQQRNRDSRMIRALEGIDSSLRR